MISPYLRVLALAATLAACASSRALDKSFSDIAADAELKGVLFTDMSHDYSDVDLTVYEGRLMLTGGMRSEEGHRKLIENAWKADGVKEVIDEVIVAKKTPFGQAVEDARIDKVLRARLIANKDVTSSDYKFSVSRGVVYLLGAARSLEELEIVIEYARSISGVEKVVSHLVLHDLNAVQ